MVVTGHFRTVVESFADSPMRSIGGVSVIRDDPPWTWDRRFEKPLGVVHQTFATMFLMNRWSHVYARDSILLQTSFRCWCDLLLLRGCSVISICPALLSTEVKTRFVSLTHFFGPFSSKKKRMKIDPGAAGNNRTLYDEDGNTLDPLAALSRDQDGGKSGVDNAQLAMNQTAAER